MSDNEQNPPQGETGVLEGGSSVTKESAIGGAAPPRAQGAGVDDLATRRVTTRLPPLEIGSEGPSGEPYSQPRGKREGGHSTGFGNFPGILPFAGVDSEGTPTPPVPLTGASSPKETPRAFVAPGSDTPTEEWKKAMVEAVSGLLTPLNQRLSFVEQSVKKRERQRGRQPSSSSESTSDYSGGEASPPERRRRPRPVVRAVSAQAGPGRVPLREIPPKIIPADDRYASLLDCETYALKNKDNRVSGAEAQGLGKKRKDLASIFGRDCEWGGDPPLGVFEFLNRFVKAANDNGLSEGRALLLLPEFTKDPLKRDLYRIRPSVDDGRRTGEVTSYLELVNWLLRAYADEHLLNEQEAIFNGASQEEDETETAFHRRLMELHAKCGYIQTSGQVRARFMQGTWWEIRHEVRNYVADHPHAPIELVVQYAQRAGDFRRRVQAAAKELKAKEDAERNARRMARRALAAVTSSPQEVGEASGSSRKDYRPSGGSRWTDGKRELFPCHVCNSTSHWMSNCPHLPEATRAQMAKARAERKEARDSARTGGAIAAVTPSPKGKVDRPSSPKGSSSDSSSSGNA